MTEGVFAGDAVRNMSCVLMHACECVITQFGVSVCGHVCVCVI